MPPTRSAADIAFGCAERRQVVGDLALQVGEVDRSPSTSRDPADAGRAEEERHRRAEAAGADHERVRSERAAPGPRCRCRRAAGGASSAAGRRRSWRSARPQARNARGGARAFGASGMPASPQLVVASALRSTAVLLTMHRLALEAVERLGELEVLGAAELERRLGRCRCGRRSRPRASCALHRAPSRAPRPSARRPGRSCRCLSRSASRVRSAANRLPSAVSSSMTSGTMPLA